MKKILISIVFIGIGLASFFYFSAPKESEESGNIEVVLIDEIGDIVSTKTLPYYEGDTLFKVLDENYDILCADASYNPSSDCNSVGINGRVILGIDTLITNWQNNYISIYINDDYAVQGIDQIELQNNAIYKFEFLVIGGASNED